MKELFGICTNCKEGTTFTILTVINQSDEVVLAEAQCKKCNLHSSVYFRLSDRHYEPITVKGNESDDHENSAPHSTPPSNDF